MSFCKFSSEYIIENKTAVDNVFINDFLPFANDACVKVYLYGLMKCSSSNQSDNSLERFSAVLGLSPEDIESAFLYWQEQGLVRVLSTNPFEVCYIPATNVISANKTYKVGKYDAFNAQVNELIRGREITKNEYVKYYETMEVYKIQPEALLMIIKYCTTIKGENIGYNYILTIARNWANENIKTSLAVEQKLQEIEENNSEATQILTIFNIKRNAYLEEKELLAKFKDMGFNLDTILFVAKNIKKQHRGSFLNLDNKLLKYYELKLFAEQEIQSYEKTKKDMFVVAKEVCKSIGVYYDNLEPVVDTYITKWLNFGYSKNTLSTIGNYCFKNNIKTLDGLDLQINKFFKLGILSDSDFELFVQTTLKQDEQIKSLLSNMGLNRAVNSFDRQFYATWTEDWKLDKTLIQYASSLACGKAAPMQYMNKVLSNWKSLNITSVEQAEKNVIKETPVPYAKKTKTPKRTYTKEELSAVYSNLEEIDL